jgi:hypothetical protein
MLPTDVWTEIFQLLSYDDLRAVECAQRALKPARARRKEAAHVVCRFVRTLIAQRQIIIRFMLRCAHEPGFRDHYLYLHMVPRPHVCFRIWPRWLRHNPLRFSLMEYAMQHDTLQREIYDWARNHNINL